MTQHGSNLDTAGVPHVILDLVVDILICGMKPLALEVQGRDVENLERETFEAMSLVHRTWTGIARRGLWRRAVVNLRNRKTIPRRSLRFQLRELAIVSRGSGGARSRILTDILCHAPNLQVVYIDIELEEESGNNFLAFIRQLGAQSCLRRLWVMGETARFLRDICIVVSRLQNLRSLVLDSFDACDHPPCSLHGLDNPPKTLESLAILDHVGQACVDWFIRPREGFAIRNLIVMLDNAEHGRGSPFTAHAKGCLPLLKSLHVLSLLEDEDAVRLQEYTLKSLQLLKATSLQHFTLTVAGKTFFRNLHLPRTLTELHIRHILELQKARERYMELGDESIASIVANLHSSSSSSHLKKLVISYSGKGGLEAGELAMLSAAFSMTLAVCRDMGIILSFKRRAPDYLGDVAEDAAFVD
ncbi:hypothetical protein DFH11DRAFT_1618425 [Phellopilus nigrolimitatus]|nr:hypothetical protein DFH11DRAFT_1618425 [Phellopilus nigrolimitatus]